METKENPAETEAKDTIFYRKISLNLGGRLHTLDRPWVMGILNVTPDSFYDGGRHVKEGEMVKKIELMLGHGADIIDIGAASSRPGAESLDAKVEMERLKPALEVMQTKFPHAHVSVDTFHSEVARFAADHGASIINDISGGTFDPQMPATMGELKLPYILMHIKGSPRDMQDAPEYEDVFSEVCHYFSERIAVFLEKGVGDIILDPGFGFGKTLEHNYELVHQFSDLKIFDRLLLAGISRKSMINKLLKIKPEQALNGTTVLNTMLLNAGANILRVHDVKEAVEAVKIFTFTQNSA